MQLNKQLSAFCEYINRDTFLLNVNHKSLLSKKTIDLSCNKKKVKIILIKLITSCKSRCSLTMEILLPRNYQ